PVIRSRRRIPLGASSGRTPPSRVLPLEAGLVASPNPFLLPPLGDAEEDAFDLAVRSLEDDALGFEAASFEAARSEIAPLAVEIDVPLDALESPLHVEEAQIARNARRARRALTLPSKRYDALPPPPPRGKTRASGVSARAPLANRARP